MTTTSDIRLYEMSGTVNNKIELNKQFKRAKKSHVSVRRRPHSEGYYKGHIYESKTYLCVIRSVCFPSDHHRHRIRVSVLVFGGGG